MKKFPNTKTDFDLKDFLLAHIPLRLSLFVMVQVLLRIFHFINLKKNLNRHKNGKVRNRQRLLTP